MPGVPGRGGPPPKRSSLRRRSNKVEGLTRAVADGQVRGPGLPGQHSPMARRFWKALRASGQAQFYEPSDWAYAELVVEAIDAFVKKPSAMMLASINSAMASLLVTEGDRRRARFELERPEPEPESVDEQVPRLEEFRRRVRAT